jgi:hypothetical protein
LPRSSATAPSRGSTYIYITQFCRGCYEPLPVALNLMPNPVGSFGESLSAGEAAFPNDEPRRRRGREPGHGYLRRFSDADLTKPENSATTHLPDWWLSIPRPDVQLCNWASECPEAERGIAYLSASCVSLADVATVIRRRRLDRTAAPERPGICVQPTSVRWAVSRSTG